MSEMDHKKPKQQGAHWIRAALQVNPFDYKGRNQPSIKFADESSYNSALLSKCQSQGISLIAITDHWCVESAKQLIEDAAKMGIVALPGFEAVSSEGIHLLVIFETGTPLSVIGSAIGKCGGVAGAGSGQLGHSFDEILSDMAMPEYNALVVPAHSNVASGGMLTIRGGNPLAKWVKHPELHAIGITPSQPESSDQAAIFKGGRPFDRDHPVSKIFSDDICHPDTLDTEGAATWFKVSNPCLDSIKMAVRMPDTRVATEDPTTSPRALIKQIAWEGGFLDGVTLQLADDLTAFIGGRGTGKSTVIESIRYALDIEPLGATAKSDHQSIVKDVLQAATSVELTIEALTPRVGQFIVRRSVHGPAEVLDSSRSITSLKPADVIGVVEVFGQHELAELAQDKSLVANMLERFAGHDGTSEADIDLLKKLADNRDDLTKAERDLDDIDAKLADLPRLNDQITHFEADGLPDKLDKQKSIAEDAGVFKIGDERLESATKAISAIKDSTLLESLKAPIDSADKSPRSKILQRIATATNAIAVAIESATKELDTVLESAQTELSQVRGDWDADTAVLRAEHAATVKKLRDEGYDPEAYLTTVSRIAELSSKKADRTAAQQTIDELKHSRTEMLKLLRASEASRESRLKDAIREANKVTGRVVNVRAARSTNRDHLKRIIINNVAGTRNQIAAAIDADDFSTRSFVAAARKGSAELEKVYNIRGAQAAGLATAGEKLLREFEEQNVGYAVDIFLNIAPKGAGTEYRQLDRLSKGQRATALLLLLLGASASPLVIDQPEDDLDNRFVYDGIVSKLCELKGKRQIIVSTHNANVPVLGDAELIITLEGDGTNGWPVENGVGSLDDATVRDLAEDLLEGGPAAFGARKHRYGV